MCRKRPPLNSDGRPKLLVVGLNRYAVFETFGMLTIGSVAMPPATSTRPVVSVVEVWNARGSSMFGPGANVFVAGLKISVDASRPVNSDSGLVRSKLVLPPVIRTRPLGIRLAPWPARGAAIVSAVVVCVTGS